MSFGQKGWDEALEMARSGNDDAIYMLKRSVKNAKSRVDLDAALTVLSELGIAIED